MISSQSYKKILFFSIILLVIGIFLFMNTKTPSKKDEQSFGEVLRGDFYQRVTIAGTVVPFHKSIITAPYNGYIKKIFVKVGDRVRQGDPLVSVTQSLQSSDNVYPIRSPLNGHVVRIDKTEGEFVKEGETKGYLLRIDDRDKLFIMSNVPEIDRLKIKLGQETIIKATAVLDKQYKGIIRELSSAAIEKEEYSRSQVAEYPVNIEILDKDQQLISGMSALVDIITEKKENILTLRHEYIHKDQSQRYVILKNGEKRNIKIGSQNEEVVEVVEGLREGDLVKQIDFNNLQEGE